MQIQMLETRSGSEDAHTVKRFYYGQTYDVADTLARRFISNGWARDTDTRTSEQVLEDFLAHLGATKLA